ncbi:Ubiquinone biosynthesis protein UbiJ [Candidatus Erwinia haradaeae]|uniref:Ubiquinone biosynthesis protein UbiJ n=1 Tax=Candidatus Erwinia haradaeae TaxID=1922217 RepID=A0A451DLF0_9GAMM|nr:SCP2 sterol-binding domain-containing protein [Candidatus Erwinia haradaeae]VFP87574.1 Ubiquinone biosynthesis protein UbiJ [Candidatus Erwinia haradaeae]
MILLKIMTAILESIINTIVYREQVLVSTQQYLCGHSLSLIIYDINLSMVFVFNKNQVKIFNCYKGIADCTITTTLTALPKLYNYRKLTRLLNSEQLKVTGNLKIIEVLLTTLELDGMELDPVEYLTLWIGDIAAESIGQFFRHCYQLMHYEVKRKKECLSETITEEWRLSPGFLEMSWFIKEVEECIHTLDIFDARICLLEIS